MTRLHLVLAAAAVWGAAATSSASAMPVATIENGYTSAIEQVHWVCNRWGRCWWRPNYYSYGYYGYPRYRYRYRYYRRYW